MNSLDYQVGGNHYKQFKIQPAEFFAILEREYDFILNYIQSSTIRYVTRFKQKNGLQDLQKVEQICNIALDFKLPKRDCNESVKEYTYQFCYENNLPIHVATIVMDTVDGNYDKVLETLKHLIELEYPNSK